MISSAGTDCAAAEAIVAEEVSNFSSRQRVREVGPAVAQLRKAAGDVIDGELARLRTRVPDLENQVKTLTDKLNNIDTTWNQRTADMQQKVSQSDSVINGLKEENQKLKNELIVAQKKVSAANLQLDDKQRTIIMQWFMYGGGVLGLGLLLGLILPHMIPSRKRKDRWMN